MRFWKILLTGSGPEQLPTPPPPPEKESEEEEVEESVETQDAAHESGAKELSPEKLKEIEKTREKYKKDARKEGADFIRKRDEEGRFAGTEWQFTPEQIEEARNEMEEDLASRAPHAPEDSLIKDKKEKKEPRAAEKEVIKASVIDVSRDIKAEARDRALHAMTESRAATKGFKGFLSKMWKHNLFYDYYLTKETYNQEEAVRSEDRSNDQAVVERFVSEYEEAIHEGEKKTFEGLNKEAEEGLKGKVKGLVMQFAKGELDEASFMEEKNRALSQARGLADKEASSYADNLLEVARTVQKRLEHQKGVYALDADIEIILGEARGGVRTEADLRNVDKIVDRLQKTRLGSMANETTIATAVSLAYSLTGGLSRRIARSRIAAALTFGGTAAVAGGIAGMREKRRVKVERAQHIRERAQGKEFEEGAEKREEMEKFTYETASASDSAKTLEAYLEKDNFYGKDLMDAVAELAEVEARIQISDRENIDLLSYSAKEKVDEERLQLDIARAKLKVHLRKFDKTGESAEGASATYKDFDTLLNECVNVKSSDLRQGEKGLDALDQAFNKYKRKQVAKAALRGGAIGMVVGVTAQELVSELRGDQQGIAEGARGETKESRNLTPLESLRQYFDTPSPDSRTELFEASEFNETGMDNAVYRMPTGFSMQEDASGEVNLVYRDEVLVQGLEFYPDGTFTNESFAKMEEAGFDMKVDTKFIEEPAGPEGADPSGAEAEDTDTEDTEGEPAGEERISRKVVPEEFIERNQEEFTPVHRELWYDNDTPGIFDKNELALHWGGEGTGLGENGNFVFDVSNMSPDGSSSDSLSVDAKEAIQKSNLKMLFSMSQDTQNFAWSVPINENGQAIIDPDSELGKIFFSQNEEGQAVFLGKYAEVAEVTETDEGIEQVRVLATHTGDGIEKIDIEDAATEPGEPGAPEEPEVPGAEPEEEPETELRQVTEYEIDYAREVETPLAEATMEAPPVIPLIPREPLGPVKEKEEGPEGVESEPGSSEDGGEAEEAETEPKAEEYEPEHENNIYKVLETSGGENITKELEEKLNTYKERMSERKQWLDKNREKANPRYRDAYFKAALVEELLDRKKADVHTVEQNLKEEYGDQFSEKIFHNAVKFLHGFIEREDKV